MSLDEFARRKGQGKFATILTDLDKSSLLEVIDSHKSDDIIAALKQQPLDIREGVEAWRVTRDAKSVLICGEVFRK